MTESTWKESISLEETNKIRVSLGLKPISETAAPKSSDALAEENFKKRKEAEAKEKDTAALKARIDKARNTKERARKLVGVGLGESDDEDKVKKEEEQEAGADAKAWVKKQKKRAKELAAKRAREQEEEDRRLQEEGLPGYGEEDLKGLKVAHGQEDFEEGEETVLTLKDSRVLDDEDDELHNLNLTENAKTAEALALKKKGRQAGQYTGYDDDEFVEGGKVGVLKKYDEEIDGKEETGFTLGGAPSAVKLDGSKKSLKQLEKEEEEREKVKLNMDYTSEGLVIRLGEGSMLIGAPHYAESFTTDYLNEDDVGFKKPKKKKKRSTRVTGTGEDEDEMQVDGAPQAITRVNLDDTNLIDDDDLAASLARARREQSKKKVAEMKKLAAAAPPPSAMDLDDAVKVESDDEVDRDDVLVMDDTSEFVRNITLAAARPPPSNTNGVVVKTEVKEEPQPPSGVASIAPKIKEEPLDVPLSEMTGGWGPAREDGEESDAGEDTEMGEAYAGEQEEVKPKAEDEDEDDIGGRSLLVSKGMASTLSILRHQGLIKERTAEELALDKVRKERDAWIAARRKADLDRELEKKRSKEAGSSKDQQTREYENRLAAQRYAQAEHDAYKTYNPVVNLTYHDEFGRDMTPKEAWRQLSHSFHGKAGGSKKTEKRLKKIEDERKREAMAAGDTPLSTAAAFAARAERLGTATMVLSVGNKGAAATQEEMLGEGPRLSKAAKGKGKATDKSSSSKASGDSSSTSAAAPVFGDIPMRALPLPASETRSASPAVRPGFQPVRGFSPITGGSGEGEKEKVGISMVPTSIKRKAVGEADGQSAAKK
ncbi:u4 tri-SnRNP-associated protein 1 [Pseudohyphozyma bogoriensis]|nr:u4 tri-SnRNP-associated protein 1 [Pseudohyphozyma bogoriensis]